MKHQDPQKDRILPPEDAAKYLDVAVNTLSVWRSTGRYDLSYIKVGRLVRYRLSDLQAFLARHTHLKDEAHE